jgi:hypothetical protein
MKRIGVSALLTITLLASALPSANAVVTPGSKCAKAGLKQTYKGKVYTCNKSGNKLVWDKGVKVDPYDAAFAAAILSEAKNEAAQILADAKLSASQILSPPNCSVSNSKALVSFGTDPNLPDPFTALVYENPGICELVVRASAEFECSGSVTVISRSTFTLKAREKIFVSWRSVERYFPLVKTECQLLTGKTPKTIGVPSSYLTRQPTVIVESSKYSGVFNQAEATKKANQVLKSAKSRADRVISEAKNPVSIARAWEASVARSTTDAAEKVKASIVCTPGSKCPLGSQGPGGGIVFYDAGSQQSWGRYLEVAPPGWYDGNSIDPMRPWASGTSTAGNTNLNVVGVEKLVMDRVNITGMVLGLGLMNSNAIVNQGNDGQTAAGAARAYSGGSKGDWYLPSIAELNLLCQWASFETVKVGKFCGGEAEGNNSRGGLVDNENNRKVYWSSTESKDGYAYAQNFCCGYQSNYGNIFHNAKSADTNHVRPIRSF